MARRKKGRRKGKQSIPIAPLAPLAYTTWKTYEEFGMTSDFVDRLMARTTGYLPSAKSFSVDYAKAFWLGEVAGIIVHRAANKTGMNKYIRKLTMGYLSL